MRPSPFGKIPVITDSKDDWGDTVALGDGVSSEHPRMPLTLSLL
jgi:hypothetical protein